MNFEDNRQNSENKINELPAEIEKIIESLPEEKKEEARKKLFSIRTFIAHEKRSSPIPSPKDMKEYDKLVKNGAERLFNNFEKQVDHRIDIEKKVFKGSVTQSGIGQIFGLVIAIFALIIAWHLAKNGHDAVASVIGGTTVIGLVTVFVIGKKKQDKD